MITTLLWIALIVSIVITIFRAIRRKRKYGKIGGFKSYLSSISLYATALVNLVAAHMDKLGIVSWTLTLIFILLGAYFTKFIPAEEKSPFVKDS
ncbi:MULTISPECIES: hypothetical protein [Pontibacillus]|uniref:YtpI-like protein n=1 Tax=Pontibacillus chungwhensis TaxID=265426 RepID=A0ABY8V2A6_9BACI|nr:MULTISPECIES: hypothetical protein [Pontibacillus]MCD5322333.1 hypothetical protein [Pontibacillus sp. HN14]WIF99623.1 hypothetical protein QNI29_08190 [Pontibacillus chungwhensis]